MRLIVAASVLAAVVATAGGAQAVTKSTRNGAVIGAVGGAVVAGPVGAVVGGVGGAVVGSRSHRMHHARRCKNGRGHWVSCASLRHR